MRILYFFCFIIINSLIPLQAAKPDLPTDISQKNKPITVKILLAKLAREAVVEAKGRFHVYNCQTNQIIDFGKNKWDRVLYTDGGLKWGERFPGYFSLRIVPIDPQSLLYVNGSPYKGCLEIHGINGTISIINEVDIENFLRATLPCKLREPLSKETLDALVVVERTHLAFLAQKDAKVAWQITANEIDYSGAKSDPILDEAIDRTQGIVMIFHNKLFPATWNRHSGGQTVSYSSIFRTRTNVPAGVLELPAKSSKEKMKWSAAIPKKLLAELTGLKHICNINSYQVCNKVYALRLSDETRSRDIDFFRLQKAIGTKFLRSTEFMVKMDDENVYFNGYGEGAGSGLCLASAEILAKNEQAARSILFTHFPGVHFKSLIPSSQEKLTSFVWE